MLIQFDYDNKIITIEDSFNLAELIKILSSQIENPEDWTIQAKKIVIKTKPIVIPTSPEPIPAPQWPNPAYPKWPTQPQPGTTPWRPWYLDQPIVSYTQGKEITGTYLVNFKTD